MPDDIFEAISLWIALHKPKSEFPSELTPELEEFWSKVEKEIGTLKTRDSKLKFSLIKECILYATWFERLSTTRVEGNGVVVSDGPEDINPTW